MQKSEMPANLVVRLDGQRADVPRFVCDFNVPFDNNRAERDIRMGEAGAKISRSLREAAPSSD